jgi:drug/metabolite transporter (DMT)-like permease
MNGIVITLVLGAALSHALWNLLLKQTESRLMMMMSMHTVTGLLGLALIPFIGPVEEAAWPMLLMSTVVHGGYYVFFDLFLSQRRTWSSLPNLERYRTNCGLFSFLAILE